MIHASPFERLNSDLSSSFLTFLLLQKEYPTAAGQRWRMKAQGEGQADHTIPENREMEHTRAVLSVTCHLLALLNLSFL